MKVLVIGAGASGLAAIRHISESPYLEGTLFEQGDKVGGLWIYSEESIDSNGIPVHSAMYHSLRTHLPKELQSYPDFPFGDTQGSFLTHWEMHKYMEDFAKFYNLMRFIKFKHKVIKVQPIFPDNIKSSKMKWSVTTESLENDTVFSEEYDSVMVCNGHCYKPYQPAIGNDSLFQGEITHSKDYRKADDRFSSKKVMVIGGGLSGFDLASEISSVATKVIFYNRGEHFDPLSLPQNVHQVQKVVSTTDEDHAGVDVIVFCTGYDNQYPFLSLSECDMELIEGKYVKPLFRDFIHSKFPTICFIGLPSLNPVMPLVDCQTRFYIKFLEGKVILPSEEEMNRQIEHEHCLKRSKGLGIRKSHSLQNDPWNYYKILGDEGNFNTDWIPLLKSIYLKVNQRRAKFPHLYKNDTIRVKNAFDYEYIEN